jgi:hypothetical protein
VVQTKGYENIDVGHGPTPIVSVPKPVSKNAPL